MSHSSRAAMQLRARAVQLETRTEWSRCVWLDPPPGLHSVLKHGPLEGPHAGHQLRPLPLHRVLWAPGVQGHSYFAEQSLSTHPSARQGPVQVPPTLCFPLPLPHVWLTRVLPGGVPQDHSYRPWAHAVGTIWQPRKPVAQEDSVPQQR